MSRKVFMILGFLGVANFAAFFLAAVFLGGDAYAGKYLNGHYYLGSHGHLTEVSENAFNYSIWHMRSLILTHPLAMLSFFLAARVKRDERS